MDALRIQSSRAAVAVWASIGFLGIGIAFYSMLCLASLSGLLHWQFVSGGTGRMLVQFVAGFSLSGLALWGIYKRTIHHTREELHHS